MFGSSKRTDVPETITDKQMRDIKRRGQWASRHEDMFGDKATSRRLNSNKQQDKRHQS